MIGVTPYDKNHTKYIYSSAHTIMFILKAEYTFRATPLFCIIEFLKLALICVDLQIVKVAYMYLPFIFAGTVPLVGHRKLCSSYIYPSL